MSTAKPTATEPLQGARIVLVVNTDWFFLSHRLPIAIAARKAGADVLVVATDTGRADEIRAAGLRFVDAKMSRMARNPLREAATLFRLWRILRQERPDMVHLVATKSVVYGGIAAAAARADGVISAVTGAGYALGVDRNRLVAATVCRLLRSVLRRSQVVIFQHEHDLDLYVERRLVDRSHTRLVRGVGVDTDLWMAMPEPPEQVVMLAARMIAEKGVHTFVDAARELRSRFPNARFVLVGPLDTEIPTAVRRDELVGWVDEGIVEWWGQRLDMHSAIAACQVFVLPTYHNEGVPKVLLEAGATGRAVVASDIPGCRAVISNDETGILVPPREPELLAGAIAHLLADPGTRSRLSTGLRARVVDRFRERDLTGQTLDIYRLVTRAGVASDRRR